jgi:hypothetical protein
VIPYIFTIDSSLVTSEKYKGTHCHFFLSTMSKLKYKPFSIVVVAEVIAPSVIGMSKDCCCCCRDSEKIKKMLLLVQTKSTSLFCQLYFCVFFTV